MKQGSRASAISYGIVVHGGVGSPLRFSDGCKRACSAAFALLKRGSGALEAVVEAAKLLENDGRFNAGSGSTLRLDGKTVEMDAGLMDSVGHLGIAISIRTVRNPILLARAIMATPHVALSGRGAELFAKKRGLESFDKPSSRSRRRHASLLRKIREGSLGKLDPRWKDCDLKSLWNFESPYSSILGVDTIGAVALDKDGNLAVANSTGGASPMLLGRVGDSPMIGCGFYAGPEASVACTGIGEEIIKKMLAKSVHDSIAQGTTVKESCIDGIRPFPGTVPTGIIAIAKTGCAVISNRPMAHYALFT